MIPISSLDSVEGLETFWPSWPPVCDLEPGGLRRARRGVDDLSARRSTDS